MSGPPDLWARFPHDPRDPAYASLRASDADRDVLHGVLAEAFADGRLDREEYDERSASVLSARTLGELPPLVTDLVPALPGATSRSLASSGDFQRRAEAHWLEQRRQAVLGFVGPTLICWAIWLATAWDDGGLDPYFPWPLIVMAVSLMNLIRVAVSREETIAEEIRRLERKQAKQLKAREQRPATEEERDA